MRILIVEDDRQLRQSVARGLREASYAVDQAADGEQALEQSEGHEYDAIILDILLPTLDGLEVCRRLRARVGQPFTYVLLLTAKNHREEFAAALEAGVDEYVVKPFEPDELRARLNVARRVVSLERRLALQAIELREARAELAKLRSA